MKGMNACKMSIEHKGVTINLSFENGNISSKRNARLTTENRFVQDAIEAMQSFGTRVVLVHAVEKSVAIPVEVEEEERIDILHPSDIDGIKKEYTFEGQILRESHHLYKQHLIMFTRIEFAAK